MGIEVVFGPCLFRMSFSLAVLAAYLSAASLWITQLLGLLRCESRGISKNVDVEGEILAQKPRRPTEIALVWKTVSDWESDSKRNPWSQALVIWNRFQLSLPLWDTSVFVPELALRSAFFTKRSPAARSVVAKAG